MIGGQADVLPRRGRQASQELVGSVLSLTQSRALQKNNLLNLFKIWVVPFRLRPLTAEIRAFRAFWPKKSSLLAGSCSTFDDHRRSGFCPGRDRVPPIEVGAAPGERVNPAGGGGV
jgi:hypothetical protein